MIRKTVTKVVTEGAYAAEVEVELIYDDSGWSPYIGLQDVQRLDTVRVALRSHDLKTASKLARIFELVPVAA